MVSGFSLKRVKYTTFALDSPGVISIDGQKLHKNIPFIARKVAKKFAQSCKKKLQINKPRSLNSEILFNQNSV